MARHMRKITPRAVGKEFEAKVVGALTRCRGEYVGATEVAGLICGRHVGGHVGEEEARLVRNVRAALKDLYEVGLLDVLWNYPRTQIVGYRLKRGALVKWVLAGAIDERTAAVGRRAARKERSTKAGVCRICGCTEDRACVLVLELATEQPMKTCAWVDETRTLCTNPKCLEAAEAEKEK